MQKLEKIENFEIKSRTIDRSVMGAQQGLYALIFVLIFKSRFVGTFDPCETSFESGHESVALFGLVVGGPRIVVAVAVE